MRSSPRPIPPWLVRVHPYDCSGALDRDGGDRDITECRPVEDVRVVLDPTHTAERARVRLGVIVITLELAVARPVDPDPSGIFGRDDESERLHALHGARDVQLGSEA